MSTATAHNFVRCVEGRGPVCPICDNKGGCMIASDGSVALCLRVRDGCCKRRNGSEVAARDGYGWLHRLTDKHRKALPNAKGMKALKPPEKLKEPDLKLLVKQQQTALSPKRLERLANDLGVSVSSLKLLQVGWDERTGCYCFPMRDGYGTLCGIRLRSLDGQVKTSVRGSRMGLFIPTSYEAKALPDTLCADNKPLVLLMPEGPTDVAAAMDAGFRAIGRPSNNSGAEMVESLLARGCEQEVVIVADRDETKYLPDGTPHWPGIEGAIALLLHLTPSRHALRFLLPPEGVKDLRDWVKAGATLDVIASILEAQHATPLWVGKARRRLAERKQNERKLPQSAA